MAFKSFGSMDYLRGIEKRSMGANFGMSLFSPERIAAALIFAVFALRLNLLFVYEINWDEFLHLSRVYDFERGDLGQARSELGQAIKTLYVHAFRWLVLAPGNEVDQVIAARVVMYALSAGTAGFLFMICRRLLPVRAALLAVLAYVTFSFTIRQGNSFRTDPVAAFLLMAALWLIICHTTRLRNAVLSGGLIGLAGAVTVKSAVYVPTIALVLVIALWFAENRVRAFNYGVGVALSAVISFLMFFLAHQLTLNPSSAGFSTIQHFAGKSLIEPDLTNTILTFKVALKQNPIFWLAIALGFLACLRGLIQNEGRERMRWLVLLALGAPLGSLAFYSLAYPYYYPFMLAPAAALCGAALDAIPERLRSAAMSLATVGFGMAALLVCVVALQQDNHAQRRTLEAIHRMFPEPTTYIDRSSMVSSFPKAGFFMSVWGMQSYYQRGEAVMRSILDERQPRFLIANREMLDLDALGPDEYGPQHFGLFQEDVKTLKANFLRHWGAIYVAGKRLSVSPNGPAKIFEILIGGPYTVESPVPVVIDGRELQPGAVVTLRKGLHRIDAIDAAADVTLRWGAHIFRPSEPPPGVALFRGF